MLAGFPIPDFDFDDDQLVPIAMPVPTLRPETISDDYILLCDEFNIQITNHIPIRCTGNSVVFIGKSDLSDQECALKFSRHKNRISEEYQKRLNLPDSPYLVKSVNIYESSNCSMLQMELCEDGDLSGKTFPEAVLWQLIHDIGVALEIIHSTGWIHLDISPSNILSDGNRFKLADFGTLLQKDSFQPGCEGAGPYVSPETMLFPEEPVGPPTDIFSFGIVLLELASGFYAPRGGEERYGKLRRGEIKLGDEKYTCDASPDLINFINSMMSPDQNLRPTAVDLSHHPRGIQAAAYEDE